MQNLAVYAYNEYKNPGVDPGRLRPGLGRGPDSDPIVMILNLIARLVYRRFGTEIR